METNTDPAKDQAARTNSQSKKNPEISHKQNATFTKLLAPTDDSHTLPNKPAATAKDTTVITMSESRADDVKDNNKASATTDKQVVGLDAVPQSAEGTKGAEPSKVADGIMEADVSKETEGSYVADGSNATDASKTADGNNEPGGSIVTDAGKETDSNKEADVKKEASSEKGGSWNEEAHKKRLFNNIAKAVVNFKKSKKLHKKPSADSISLEKIDENAVAQIIHDSGHKQETVEEAGEHRPANAQVQAQDKAEETDASEKAQIVETQPENAESTDKDSTTRRSVIRRSKVSIKRFTRSKKKQYSHEYPDDHV